MSAMTYDEIYAALCETELPVVYNFWEADAVPELPFIIFSYPNNLDYIADNTNYVTIVTLEVELFTKRKNLAIEAAVEAILSKYWAYTKSSQWIDADDVQQTIYDMEVIIKHGQ